MQICELDYKSSFIILSTRTLHINVHRASFKTFVLYYVITRRIYFSFDHSVPFLRTLMYDVLKINRIQERVNLLLPSKDELMKKISLGQLNLGL